MFQLLKSDKCDIWQSYAVEVSGETIFLWYACQNALSFLFSEQCSFFYAQYNYLSDKCYQQWYLCGRCTWTILYLCFYAFMYLSQVTKLVVGVPWQVVTMGTEGLAWSYRTVFGNYKKKLKEKKHEEINWRLT